MATLQLLQVDDDRDDHLITRVLLESNPELDFRMDCAPDYAAGLAMLLGGRYDVALVDYHLGADDGLELVRAATAAGCPTPMILLTGTDDREVDVAAMEAGAADFLVKQRLEPRLLERAVRFAVRRRQAEAALRRRCDKLTRAGRRLSRQALTDPLTGLANRRRLDGALRDGLSLAARLGRALSLILLDVDHFKAYNDDFGHAAGDDVLRKMAHLLAKGTRAHDTAARHGGEEFAILLPATGPRDAARLAERLRAAVADTDWPARPVTASLGVATSVVGTTSAAGLLEQADDALYRAKRGGRDRVVHHDLPDAPAWPEQAADPVMRTGGAGPHRREMRPRADDPGRRRS